MKNNVGVFHRGRNQTRHVNAAVDVQPPFTGVYVGNMTLTLTLTPTLSINIRRVRSNNVE